MIRRTLKTEEEYQNALNRFEEIFFAKEGTPEGDESDILALIIEDYEEKHYKIETLDPIEMIKIRMEEQQLNQRDLAEEFGGVNRVSEVLNRKRRLTLEMIRKLNVRLGISLDILIQDYQLKT